MTATLGTAITASASITSPARPPVRHLVAPAAAIAALAMLIALLPGLAHVPATDLVARPMGTPALQVETAGRAIEAPAMPIHAGAGLDR